MHLQDLTHIPLHLYSLSKSLNSYLLLPSLLFLISPHYTGACFPLPTTKREDRKSIPCKIGFPHLPISLTPIQTNLPLGSEDTSVWFTITVPKAAKGHGESRSERAVTAARIQYSRMEYGRGEGSEGDG